MKRLPLLLHWFVSLGKSTLVMEYRLKFSVDRHKSETGSVLLLCIK